MGWYGGRGRKALLDVAVTAEQGEAVVKCLHCGESARVDRSFAAVMESWFASEHRCGVRRA